MREIRCPHCKEVFQVDEAAFESIAQQVRNSEFEKELSQREAALRKQMASEFDVREARARNELDKKLLAWQTDVQKRDVEIDMLKTKIRTLDDRNALELEKQLAKKDADIAELKRQISQGESSMKIALLEKENSIKDDISKKDEELSQLRATLERQRLESEAQKASLIVEHQNILKAKDKEIDLYKSFKTGLSVKLLGEGLEQHCAMEFERAQMTGLFPDARFGKDNDTTVAGTKGDFIFRDYIDGEEYVSIMFEMKNESPTSVNRHRNIDFLDKLNKDRNDKRCEYAVLVTMLEQDNELYNKGIVNMSHRYPKMFVIRPTMFIELIALLCQSSRTRIGEIVTLRAELAQARSQSIDITNFERRRDQFVTEFTKLIGDHTKKHEAAMGAIDKVIDALEKQANALREVKRTFEMSTQKILKAGDAAENKFTIKKLTHGNPTMKARFEEARRLAQNDIEDLAE